MSPWLDPECPGSQGKDRKKMLPWLFTPRKEQCRRVHRVDGGAHGIVWPSFPSEPRAWPHPAGVPWRGLYSHLSDLTTEHRPTVRS